MARLSEFFVDYFGSDAQLGKVIANTSEPLNRACYRLTESGSRKDEVAGPVQRPIENLHSLAEPANLWVLPCVNLAQRMLLVFRHRRHGGTSKNCRRWGRSLSAIETR